MGSGGHSAISMEGRSGGRSPVLLHLGLPGPHCSPDPGCALWRVWICTRSAKEEDKRPTEGLSCSVC